MLWRKLPAFPREAMAGFQDDLERRSGVYELVVRPGALLIACAVLECWEHHGINTFGLI